MTKACFDKRVESSRSDQGEVFELHVIGSLNLVKQRALSTAINSFLGISKHVSSISTVPSRLLLSDKGNDSFSDPHDY